MEDFGTRLKRFREARGWSQETVGFELDVSKATVSKWETGRSEPNLEHLSRIRALFARDGLTLDHLIAGVETARALAELPPRSARAAQSVDEEAMLARFRALTP